MWSLGRTFLTEMFSSGCSEILAGAEPVIVVDAPYSDYKPSFNRGNLYLNLSSSAKQAMPLIASYHKSGEPTIGGRDSLPRQLSRPFEGLRHPPDTSLTLRKEREKPDLTANFRSSR